MVERSGFMVAWFDGSRFVWWLRGLAFAVAVAVGITLAAPVAAAEPGEAADRAAVVDGGEVERALEAAVADSGDGEELSAADEVAAQVTARASGKRVLVESLTTVSSRSWVNPDGTMTVEDAGVPIRFVDQEGAWREIDTTLKADAKGSTAVASSPLGLSLAGASRAAAGGKRGSGETDLVAVVEPAELTDAGQVMARKKSAGSGEVVLAWPGALPEPAVKGDTARYAEVSPGWMWWCRLAGRASSS